MKLVVQGYIVAFTHLIVSFPGHSQMLSHSCDCKLKSVGGLGIDPHYFEPSLINALTYLDTQNIYISWLFAVHEIEPALQLFYSKQGLS